MKQVAVILCALFISFAAKSQKVKEKELVIRCIQTLFEGMKSGDSNAVSQIFHEKARLITCTFNAQKEPIVVEMPLKEFLKFIGTPHSAVYEERILNYDIKIDEGLASVWTPYEFYVDDKLSHSGVNAFQLCKTKMGWKIIQITDTRKVNKKQKDR